ncbi:MAG: ribonuclease H-like domain-containing protein [Polyangiales bacterium]
MKLRDKLGRLAAPVGSPTKREARMQLDVAVEVEVQTGVVDARGVRDDDEDEWAARARLGEDIAARRGRIANLRAQLDGMRVARPQPAAPVRRPVQKGDWCDDDIAPMPRAKIDPTLPGDVLDTALGALHRVLTVHAEDHRHGVADVIAARVVHGPEVALLSLDASLADIDFAHALYIDTETTGLSGGSGTLPFLIGMAWFEGPCLHVEQLLLPKPGAEVPMLVRLRERLASASAVVSYNGKSFDWPLLRTRFVMNRMTPPALPAHLDLLHCARRVYKSRLGSVRLVCLEQDLLGFERIDDIAGEAIPAMYLGYVRGMLSGSCLAPVVEHNRSDLVALPALLGDIVRRFQAHSREDARDQLGFARVAARGAELDRAIALAHAAAEADVRGVLSGSALQLLGELRLKAGELERAIDAFEGAIAASTSRVEAARAHLALAKLHEHKTKRLDLALRHAAETAAAEGEDESRRRVARIVQRSARKQVGSPSA